MTSINASVQKYKLKNKATSNIKFYQVFSSLSLNDIGVYLRDGLFESDIETVNLHPTKRTHWVLYMNETYFDSYGCVYPKKISKFIKKRYGQCLYSEYKIQSQTKKEIVTVQIIVYIQIFLTKVIGIVLILNLLF